MGAGPYQEIIICICAFFSWYYVGDSVRNLFNLSLSIKKGGKILKFQGLCVLTLGKVSAVRPFWGTATA